MSSLTCYYCMRFDAKVQLQREGVLRIGGMGEALIKEFYKEGEMAQSLPQV